MRLKRLKLTNYRNCGELDINCDRPKILIIGKNAQGKTNILESIYFLSCLKTPRTSNIKELINFSSDAFRADAVITKASADIDMSFSYNSEKKRETKINGVKSTIKDFKSVFKTVLFSTSDLLLLRGTPQDRRDWLDRAISQVYPAYDDRLSKYEKIRTQKNNFLKTAAKTGVLNPELLDVFNEQLSVTGSNIIYIRKKFLKEISATAGKKHSMISSSENLTVKYVCSFEIDKADNETIPSPEEILRSFSHELATRREEEIRRCQACVGPHRDDIAFFINGLESVKFASQGQQRTIVLSLKLAELDIITEKTGDEPVLLLDDVLAELDDLRQNYLLKSVKTDIQTIITSVDTLLFEEEFLKDVKILKIENGCCRD